MSTIIDTDIEIEKAWSYTRFIFSQLIKVCPPAYKRVEIELWAEGNVNEFGAASTGYTISVGRPFILKASKEMIMFALAHELAHIILGHTVVRCEPSDIDLGGPTKERAADFIGMFLCEYLGQSRENSANAYKEYECGELRGNGESIMAESKTHGRTVDRICLMNLFNESLVSDREVTVNFNVKLS